VLTYVRASGYTSDTGATVGDLASWSVFASVGRGRVSCAPNGSHAKLCGRSRAPKPKRRAGCRD
jgi:hypothetical protein